MPKEVERAIEILGHRARTEILRILSAGELSTGEITERLGADKGAVSRHLAALEAADMITSDVPPETRRGRRTTWRVVPGSIRKVAATWASYAEGTGDNPADRQEDSGDNSPS